MKIFNFILISLFCFGLHAQNKVLRYTEGADKGNVKESDLKVSYGSIIDKPNGSEFLSSDRNFPLGTLIQTSIPYLAVDNIFFLEIKGNSYANLTPIELKAQGYLSVSGLSSQGAISSGYPLSSLVCFEYLGNLCFWYPNQGYWQGYDVRCTSPLSVGYNLNKVISVTNSSKPTAITKEYPIQIIKVINSSNISSYTPTLQAVTDINNTTSKPINLSGYGSTGGGIYGSYDPTIMSTVYSMSPSFSLSADGLGAGNLYGIARTYEKNYGGVGRNSLGIIGLGHQYAFVENGINNVNIGSGIWLRHNIQALGNGLFNNVFANINVRAFENTSKGYSTLFVGSTANGGYFEVYTPNQLRSLYIGNSVNGGMNYYHADNGTYHFFTGGKVVINTSLEIPNSTIGVHALNMQTGDDRYMTATGVPNNSSNYINARVIQNSNTSSLNDGLYIGYNNSNMGTTRIFGGGSTSTGLFINGPGYNDVRINGGIVFNQGNYSIFDVSNLTLGTLPDARLSTNIPKLNAASNDFLGNLKVQGQLNADGPSNKLASTLVSTITANDEIYLHEYASNYIKSISPSNFINQFESSDTFSITALTHVYNLSTDKVNFIDAQFYRSNFDAIEFRLPNVTQMLTDNHKITVVLTGSAITGQGDYIRLSNSTGTQLCQIINDANTILPNEPYKWYDTVLRNCSITFQYSKKRNVWRVSNFQNWQ